MTDQRTIDTIPYWAAVTQGNGRSHAPSRMDKLLSAAAAARQARRAEKEARFQAKLAEPVASDKAVLTWVRVGDIRIDRRYQVPERYNEDRAKEIAAGFSWDECEPLSCNVRPDDAGETVWCYDGNHRRSAILMRFGPDEAAPARVIRVPYEREAELFAEQDRLSKPVPKSIKFTAKVEAADPPTLEQQAILTKLGLRLGHTAEDRQVAINTFVECGKTKGLAATEEGLRALLQAYHGSAQSLTTPMVKGVVWFVANRGDDPRYDYERLLVALKKASVREILEYRRRVPSGLKAYQAVTWRVIELFNDHRPAPLQVNPWNKATDK